MKTILFSILILFSINGFGFNWKMVAGSLTNDHYVDDDSIKKHNGLVYYWMLGDFFELFKDGTNSKIHRFKVNCVEEKQTWLKTISYSQSMGRGRILHDGTPNVILYPNPNTIRYNLMKFACNY